MIPVYRDKFSTRPAGQAFFQALLQPVVKTQSGIKL